MQDKISNDLKIAQLARDELKTSVLRMLRSELKYAEISSSQPLTDEQIITVLSKELKKRSEAAESFATGGRPDLAEREKQEAEIISAYLPAQISDQQLQSVVKTTITELGASSIADMGKVIAAVKQKTAGTADSARISACVRLNIA